MENQKTTDIFICTHKDFKICPSNKTYKIITDETTDITNKNLEIIREGNSELSSKEFSYAEGSRIYWILNNIKLKKYIGICHYRTYFDFFDDIPDIDAIFKNYDLIATQKYNFDKDTLETQYNKCHCGLDLTTIGLIIQEFYPDYIDAWDKTKNQNFMFIRNMFIMKKDDFIECYNFAFDILKKFDKIFHLETYEDIIEKTKNNCKSSKNIKYQSRIQGFLLERITNIYINKKYDLNKIKEFSIITTENRKW